MAKYLDYSGLKRFKSYMDNDVKKTIKDIIGLDASKDRLEYAKNEDIDSVLSKEETGDGVVKLKTFAYYHNQLPNVIRDDKSDLNNAIQSAVANALVLKTDESDVEVKTEIYENVEAIVDEKMKWKNEFPI